MEPLVSILIPAYNAEKWISDTVRSALAQTWPRKEIIVVDDGSTDRTQELARKFESSSVCVLAQANQGAPAARNRALRASRGDYIQWLDADDLLAADKISAQLESLEEGIDPTVLFSCSWGRFFHRPDRAAFVPTPLWRDLAPVEWLILKLGHNLYMPNSTWLVSRQLTQAAGPWNERLAVDDDGEYFARVLLCSSGVRFIPGTQVYYRQSGSGGVSHIGVSEEKLRALWLSMTSHISYLLALEDSVRSRQACVAYLQSWLRAFHPFIPEVVAEMTDKARWLGGELSPLRLSWRYRLIAHFLGVRTARRTQVYLPNLRRQIAINWEKAILSLESHIT